MRSAIIKYQTMIADGLVVPFDRDDLAEVLGNLVENAARYARSQVRIAAQLTPDGAAISVEDDGPGIAPELRSTALARGSRLDERGNRPASALPSRMVGRCTSQHPNSEG